MHKRRFSISNAIMGATHGEFMRLFATSGSENSSEQGRKSREIEVTAPNFDSHLRSRPSSRSHSRSQSESVLSFSVRNAGPAPIRPLPVLPQPDPRPSTPSYDNSSATLLSSDRLLMFNLLELNGTWLVIISFLFCFSTYFPPPFF